MISKLSEEQIVRLRRMSGTGVPNSRLSEIFDISKSTVARYKSDFLRELSRNVQRKKYQSENSCYKCGMATKVHDRCQICEILIHEGEHCESCIKRYQLH